MNSDDYKRIDSQIIKILNEGIEQSKEDCYKYKKLYETSINKEIKEGYRILWWDAYYNYEYYTNELNNFILKTDNDEVSEESINTSKYCYVALRNEAIDGNRNNIIRTYEVNYDSLPDIVKKKGSKYVFNSILGPVKKRCTYYEPLPILCELVDNKYLYDILTGSEFELYNNANKSNIIGIKYDNIQRSINLDCVTDKPLFAVADYIPKEVLVDILKSLDSSDIYRYTTQLNQLKNGIITDYHKTIRAIDQYDMEHQNDDEFLSQFKSKRKR